MNAALARIHARICGDGNISRYETSEQDRNRRAEIMYTNYDEDNISEFRDDLNSQFGVKGTKYQNRVRIKSIRLVESLEEKFDGFGSKDFRLPKSIFESNDAIKLAWLRAFIRDEGYYEKKNNRLRIKLMNKKALVDMQDLLADLGVSSRITGQNCDGSWYLTVSNLDQYDKISQISENKPKVK